MTDNGTLHREESFHDVWAGGVAPDSVLVDESFEACTAPENRYIMGRLGTVRGKRILELGCGAGEASVYLAKHGAVVTASDLSAGMLSLARAVALQHKVTIQTLKCSANQLPCPDGSFDIVYAANVLHHTDMEATLREVRRVLREGGLFASWDPLAHNLVIKLYRRKAGDVRTAEEHPLTMGCIKTFRRHFREARFTTTWFFTLWVFVSFYLRGVDPNRERYWKKVIYDHAGLERTYRRLEALDRTILGWFPFLRRYCWNIVVIARK
jgi:SAM-dependent methyltransferase